MRADHELEQVDAVVRLLDVGVGIMGIPQAGESAAVEPTAA
jgi:hypothetical protein